MRRLTSIFLLSLLTFACKKDSTLEPESMKALDYFPVEIGNFWEYKIVAIQTDIISEFYDTIRYQLKETITKRIDSTETEQVYRLEREIRKDSVSQWEQFDAQKLIVKRNAIIRQIENLPILSLSYPLVENKSWNANAYNTEDSLFFKIISTDYTDSLVIPGLDSLVYIQQHLFESAINIDEEYELYAPGIGLVYRKDINAESQNITIDANGEVIPILERIEIGSFFYKTLVDWHIK